jgi:hypothetical protein
MLLGNTATIGWLTAAHWEGYTAPSPSLRWIVFAGFNPETVSLHFLVESAFRGAFILTSVFAF